jgi:hypothetical protein
MMVLLLICEGESFGDEEAGDDGGGFAPAREEADPEVGVEGFVLASATNIGPT